MKYNIPISTYKTMTQFSDSRISQIIKDLELYKYIKKSENKIKPVIFIADNSDVEKLFKLAENSSTRIADLITNDTTNIVAEFNKLKISEKDKFDIWEYLFIGNILIGQGQLFYISDSLLNDNLNNNSYNVCYNSIIENNNPILDNFYYINYIDGTSASSICEFGNYQQLTTEYWHDNERKYIIPAEDNFKLFYIAKNYSNKILPILKSELPRIKEYYTNSHYNREIEFNVFYYWYYHFIYSKSIKKLIDNRILKKPENNFKYTRLNYCG